jgi:hypothetical protein
MPFVVHRTPPALTPGVYKAQVADVKAIEGQFGPRLMWAFEMTHQGHAYTALSYTDTSFYTGSREHAWASLILGQELQPDTEISESELIGAPVLARIACKNGREGKVFYNVEDLIAPKASEDSEPAAGIDDDVPF